MLRFEGSFPDEVRRALTRDLQAGLRHQGLVVCLEPAGSTPSIARVTISSFDESDITIEVDDRWTNKRVLREVGVTWGPGRTLSEAETLALAVATEELLSASWAELDLAERKELLAPFDSPEDSELHRDNGSSDDDARPADPRSRTPAANESPTRWTALLGGRALLDPHHQAAWGGFLGISRGSVGRTAWPWIAEGNLGGQWGRASTPSFGAVESWGLSVEARLSAPWVRIGKTSFGPTLATAGQLWFYRPRPRPGVGAKNHQSWTWTVLGGLEARHRGRRQEVGLALCVGGALRGSEVTDGRRSVAGYSGLLVEPRAHWGVRW